MSQNTGDVSRVLILNGPKFKTVTGAYNLRYLRDGANIEISYSNIFGVGNANGYRYRVFKCFKNVQTSSGSKKLLRTCKY